MRLDIDEQNTIKQSFGIRALGAGSVATISESNTDEINSMWVDYIWVSSIIDYFPVPTIVSVMKSRSSRSSDLVETKGLVFTRRFAHEGSIRAPKTVITLQPHQDNMIDKLGTVSLVPKVTYLSMIEEMGNAGLEVYTFFDGGYSTLSITEGMKPEGSDSLLLPCAIEMCKLIVENGDDDLLKHVTTLRFHP